MNGSRAIAALSLCFVAGAAFGQTAEPPPPLPAPAAAAPVKAVPASATVTAVPAAPAPRPEGDASPASTVWMKDGQSMHGRVVSRDAGELTLDLGSGARVTIPADQVVDIRVDAPGGSPAFRPDPNRSRYLYSPSGFMLGKGEAYFSQTELLFSSLAYGVTDHVTIGVGSAVPALFVRDGANFIGTLKVGGSPNEGVHLAGGVQALWLPGLDSGASAGIVFGAVTLGHPDLHLGLAVGAPFVVGSGTNEFGHVLFSVSGSARVGRNVALVTENWILPAAKNNDFEMVNALAFRLLGGSIAVDLGFMHVPGAGYPVPWLDFTYNLN